MAEFSKRSEVVGSKVDRVQSYTTHLGATSQLKVHCEVSDNSSSCKKEHPETSTGLKKEKECLHGSSGDSDCKSRPSPMAACYRGEKKQMDARLLGAQSWFSPYTYIPSISDSTSSSHDLSKIQSQQLADENPFSLFAYPFGHMKVNPNHDINQSSTIRINGGVADHDHKFSHMDQLFGPDSRSTYK